MKNFLLFFVGFLFVMSSTSAQKVTDVQHVAYTVSDTDLAVNFLTKTVGAKLDRTTTISGDALQKLFGIQDDQLSLKVSYVKIGNESVQLLEFDSKMQGKIIPQDSRSNDLWFQHIAIVVKNMNKAYEHAYKNKIEHVSTFPQVLPDYIPAAAGIAAFYFRDRDDHNLELIYFPEGKGNPKWRKSTEPLFLGIDHTAIGIADTDKSLAFYRDALGLKVAGNSENFGTEQEHLNQVFGARLLITGLHAEKGFGVEFLQYIAPPGGRTYPSDSTPLDHWYWHTGMEVDNIEEVHKKIQNNNYKTVSSGIQSLPKLGYKKALVVRDPDGHAILLFEKF